MARSLFGEGRWLGVGVDGGAATWRRLAWAPGASALPPGGPFDGAVVFLDRGRDAWVPTLGLTAGVLAPGAEMAVVLENAAGGRSFADVVRPMADEVRDGGGRGHARITWVRGWREPLRSLDGAWTETPTPAGPLAALPGTFAMGRVDPGSLLLAEVVPRPAGRLLDLGVGPGFLTRALRGLGEDAVGVDIDAWAVASAARNLPQADIRLGDGLATLRTGERFDVVVSNPPLHVGLERSPTIVKRWREALPEHLATGGVAWFVTPSGVRVDGTEVVARRDGYVVVRFFSPPRRSATR